MTAIAEFRSLEVPLEPGITLVEASAGTGKTFAITRLVLRLLLEQRSESLGRILVVTFTEKAAQELVTRIRDTIRTAEHVFGDDPPARVSENDDLFLLRDKHGESGYAIVRRALSSLDELAVYTIHSFCHRILSESALESKIPFRTTFIQDESELLQRAGLDWARRRLMDNEDDARLVAASGRDFLGWNKEFVSRFRRLPGTVLEADLSDAAQNLVHSYVSTVDAALEDEKRRRHLLGFDDLLRKVHNVIVEEGHAGPLATRIRQRFSAALVDEFQDTDPTQFPIFSVAFTGCPLFLIGDPKQSIYNFRGADINAYLQASAAAERRYTLLSNYRSTSASVDAVGQLFSLVGDPFRLGADTIGFPVVSAAREPEPPGSLATDGRRAMEWWWLDGSLGVRGFVAKDKAMQFAARAVANEIVKLHSANVPLRSIAVLARMNGSARIVKDALDAAKIPAAIGSDADVMKSDEADEILRLAVAMDRPQDSRAVRAAMATRLWGSSADDIAATLQPAGEASWLTHCALAARGAELWRTRGPAAAIGELLAERHTAERILALENGERRLTNVRHLVELIHESWAIDGLLPSGFAEWYSRELQVANTPDRREIRLETDDEAVQILTVHKAKGLQFDVVFCPDLWNEGSGGAGSLGITAALDASVAPPVFDLGTKEVAQRKAREIAAERAESVRLAYVALTRGVHRTYIVWGMVGKASSEMGNTGVGHLLGGDLKACDRDTLQQLVDSSGGAMALSDIGECDADRIAPVRAANEPAVRARESMVTQAQLQTWRSSSFTGLTAGSHQEHDRDRFDVPITATIIDAREGSGFRSFPAGAQTGVALHEVFELIDFRDTRSEQLPDLVERTLARHGLLGDSAQASRRVGDVTEMVRSVCGAEIPGAGFALSDVPPDSTMREWRFDMSVSGVSPRVLAEKLERYGSASGRLYASQLRRLGENELHGYLSGFVDLVVEHRGKWWVVDWKSNQLGLNDSDYVGEKLSVAMMDAHYTLQYHLYMTALHRHLKVRQRGYSPEQHFGGAAYAFLRGAAGSVAAEAKSTGGWFVDKPSVALLDALDEAMGRSGSRQ